MTKTTPKPGLSKVLKTADVCRKHGISDATFYKRKARFGGLEVPDTPMQLNSLTPMRISGTARSFRNFG